MLISFIITNYNIPIPLLTECIEGILALNLSSEEREIILVDDGSEVSPIDELGELAKEIRFVRQENQGLSCARNTGIDIAKGDYIQFVDGDDCLIPDGYNIIIDELRKGYYDLVMFSLSDDQQPRKNLARRLKLFYSTFGDVFLKQHNLRASACGYAFSKKILGDLRFSKGLFHEDELFTPQLLLKANSIAHTNIKAYYYRTREESITRKQTPEHIEKRFNDFFNIIQQLKELSVKDKSCRSLERRVNQLCMDFLYIVGTTTRDFDYFENVYTRLYTKHLAPLPVKKYTLQYFIFSFISRFHLGRKQSFKYICR